MKLVLAICGSLQDRNQSTVPGYEDYNEMGGITDFLIPQKIRPLLSSYEDITYGTFRTWPESQDKTPLEGLIIQYKRAQQWLDSTSGDKKLILGLHTDSGDFPHTFGLYGRQQSYKAAEVIAESVGRVFHHAYDDVRIVNHLGDIEYSQYIFNTLTTDPSIIIEICSHQSESDMEILWNNPDAVAKGIVDGVLEYAGISEHSSNAALAIEQ